MRRSSLPSGLLPSLASVAVIVLGGISNPTFNLTAQLLLALTAVTAVDHLLGRMPWRHLAALPLLSLGLFQTPLRGDMDRERLANRGITTNAMDTIESLSGKPDFRSPKEKLPCPDTLCYMAPVCGFCLKTEVSRPTHMTLGIIQT